MKKIVLICMLCSCGACTSPRPLSYRNSGTDRQDEILYLYPFLALHKWIRVDQIGVPATNVMYTVVVVDKTGKSMRLLWESVTNNVYDIVRSEWQETELAGHLPDNIGAPFVRDVSTIGWKPTTQVIFGSGCNPNSYSTNWLAGPPPRQFFVMSYDRVEFYDPVLALINIVVGQPGEWNLDEWLNNRWGIATHDAIPVETAFETWKKKTKTDYQTPQDTARKLAAPGR